MVSVSGTTLPHSGRGSCNSSSSNVSTGRARRGEGVVLTELHIPSSLPQPASHSCVHCERGAHTYPYPPLPCQYTATAQCASSLVRAAHTSTHTTANIHSLILREGAGRKTLGQVEGDGRRGRVLDRCGTQKTGGTGASGGECSGRLDWDGRAIGGLGFQLLLLRVVHLLGER